MTSLNYTTNIIDSTVKSCLNYHDPHLIFDDEPYKDTLRGTKYLLFPATVYFLPQELADFRCHNCGFTSFYRNGFTPMHLIKVPSVNSTYQTAIAARSARIRCRNCNSTCSASSELTDHGCQISKLLKGFKEFRGGGPGQSLCRT